MIIRTLGCIVAAAALAGTACQRENASVEASAPTTGSVQSAPGPAEPEAPADLPAPSATAYSAATLELLERYSQQAQALSAMLIPGVDTGAATGATETLLGIGAEVVPAFIARHPHCDAYLTAAMEVRSGWPQMDAESLERDFHKDGALPQVQGDAKTCYHMKDLVVHPATALVLLSQESPDVASARKEITEVIAHAHVVKRS